MAQNLFPVIDSPRIACEGEGYDKRYKKSFAWDLQKGDFVRDGTNRVPVCNGIEAYQTWCEKTVMTERYCCLAYPDEIGTEIERAMNRPSQRSCESAIERTIKEALLVNPRTEYVRGFSFSWDGDAVLVEFLVKGIQYEEFLIRKKLGDGKNRGEDDGQQASF